MLMMIWERLLTLAFACPGCVLAAGRALFGLGAAMLLLGFRVDRMLTRLAARTGAEAAGLIDAWPSWLRVLVPDSAAGLVVAVLFVVIGLVLSRTGRWAQRLAV